MAKPVFTIFFHGTCANDSDPTEAKHQELVHELAGLMNGIPLKDYIVVDGPGAPPPKGHDGNPLPGTYNPFTKDRQPKVAPPGESYSGWAWRGTENWASWATGGKQKGPPLPANNPKSPNYDPKYTPSYEMTDTKIRNINEGKPYEKTGSGMLGVHVRGMLMGEGMDDNIRWAIGVLGDRFLDTNDEFIVNMVGWSRGGVTCIRAANWIKEYFAKRAEVNIFAFDPVPGDVLGDKIADCSTLPDNIKNYVAVLCLDDRRATFRPVDMKMIKVNVAAGSSIALLPLPGTHTSIVYFAANSGRLHPAVEVSRYLAWKFLTLQGSSLKVDGANNPTSWDAAGICERYASMMLNREGYVDLTKGFMQAASDMGQSVGPRIVRDVKINRPDYISRGNADYFINEHHLTCFVRALPGLAQYLGVSPLSQQRLGGNMESELASMPGRLRLSYRLLHQVENGPGEPPPGWRPQQNLLAKPARPQPQALASNLDFRAALLHGEDLLGELIGGATAQTV
jgi:hypothetical protein